MNSCSYERVMKMEPQPAYSHVHQETVQRVNEIMPGEEELFDLAELFKVFGDSTRIRILYVLFESDMCVCGIAELLGMTQSAISHQLAVLKRRSWCGTGGRERRFFTPFRTTTCARFLTRAWSI